MTKIDHTRILNAYLSRLSKNHLKAIIDAENDWRHASLNLGNSAQLERQTNFYNVVSKAIDSIIQYDLDIIENVINEEVTA